MSLLDDLDAANAMHLTPFIRLRATRSANPYNPRATANDWTDRKSTRLNSSHA